MVSDVPPQARKHEFSRNTSVAAVAGLAILCFSLILTGCAGAGLAANNPTQSATGTQPTPTPSVRRYLKISGALPTATVGVPYNAALNVGSGTSPYKFSMAWGGLPAGLKLGETSGTITGTPTAVGTADFAVHVIDARRYGGFARHSTAHRIGHQHIERCRDVDGFAGHDFRQRRLHRPCSQR